MDIYDKLMITSFMFSMVTLLAIQSYAVMPRRIIAVSLLGFFSINIIVFFTSVLVAIWH